MVVRNNSVSRSATRCIRNLPGPRRLPLLGSALRIRRERLHQTLEQWNREYGEVFRLRLARQDFVVLSNPETIATVLRDRPDGFMRRRRLEETARELGFGGVFSANGETWKRQRRMVQHGLDPTHVKAFFPTLMKVTQRFARRWQRAAVSNETIDLLADLMRYTVDVTAGLAFGADINTTESDEEIIQAHLDKLLPALFKRVLAPVPYWRYVKLPGDRRVERHLVAVRGAVDGFIRAARRRLEQRPELREQPRNLIEAMLAARDAAGSQVTDDDVSGNVLTMLLAGEDTTANTLAWALWFLHCHRDALHEADKEALTVLGEEDFPTRHEQLSQMRFIEACINETMRLKPAAPIIVLEAGRDRRAPLFGRSDLSAGTLAGRRRNTGAGQLGEESRDALRLRSPPLPGPLPGARGDEDGHRDAAAAVRNRNGAYPGRRGAARTHGLYDVPRRLAAAPSRANDRTSGGWLHQLASSGTWPGSFATRPSQARTAG